MCIRDSLWDCPNKISTRSITSWKKESQNIKLLQARIFIWPLAWTYRVHIFHFNPLKNDSHAMNYLFPILENCVYTMRVTIPSCRHKPRQSFSLISFSIFTLWVLKEKVHISCKLAKNMRTILLTDATFTSLNTNPKTPHKCT